MHCVNCGTQLADEANFCWQCGKPQKADAAPPDETMSERTCIICYRNVALPNCIYCEECRTTRYREFSKSLPAELKTENSPLYSDEVNEATWQICEEYGLTASLIMMVNNFILPILAGAKGEADLQAFLVKEGHLKPTQAKELVREILAFYF